MQRGRIPPLTEGLINTAELVKEIKRGGQGWVGGKGALQVGFTGRNIAVLIVTLRRKISSRPVGPLQITPPGGWIPFDLAEMFLNGQQLVAQHRLWIARHVIAMYTIVEQRLADPTKVIVARHP